MTETAIVRHETTALARPVEEIGIPVETLIARVDRIHEAQRRAMKRDHHYGMVPGVNKPTLLKPGAELLCMMFQLAPSFKAVDRWDGEHLEVVVTCELKAANGTVCGEGLGSCSTRESKYAWRKGERVCPSCGEPAIIKGKTDFGGGWICWNKPEKGKNGCGAKFRDGDESIELQTVDRVPNPDIADQYNTVRKMACKRALVAATLVVTCASEIFTQDVEDMPREERKPAAPPPQGNGQQPRGQRPIPENGDPASAAARARLEQLCAEAQDVGELSGLDDELQLLTNERVLSRQDRATLINAFNARHAEFAKGAA